MKPINLFRYLIFTALSVSISVTSTAQISRIAIVSLADTTIVNHHVGMMEATTDVLHLDFSVNAFIELQLKKYLSLMYNVSVVRLPDSIMHENKELYGAWSMNKAIKKWIVDSKNQYDLVIFTFSGGFPYEQNILVPKQTSGLYSRGRTAGFYTTIFFAAYRTNNMEPLNYFGLGGKLISPLTEFKLPDDKRSLTPEMLAMIKIGFTRHMDSRIKHFLTKTFLVDQDRIDSINANLGSEIK